MVLMKKNDHKSILQNRQLTLFKLKHATWTMEMQSLSPYPNSSIPLLPFHKGNISTNTKQDNAMICNHNKLKGYP